MREFPSGATRDNDEDKLDFDGFLCPQVIRLFAEYMHRHRVQADGKLRPSDNWKKGIPRRAYRKSGWRHWWDWWQAHQQHNEPMIQEAACALLFNLMGDLHESMKGSPIVED